MHTFAGDIIENGLLSSDKVKDWKADDTHKSIVGSLGVLISRVADEDSEKCTQYL